MGSFCGGDQEVIDESMRASRVNSSDSDYDEIEEIDESLSDREYGEIDPSTKAMENQVILLATRNANLEEELEQSKDTIADLKEQIKEMEFANAMNQ